jgi:hypothetical protein
MTDSFEKAGMGQFARNNIEYYRTKKRIMDEAPKRPFTSRDFAEHARMFYATLDKEGNQRKVGIQQLQDVFNLNIAVAEALRDDKLTPIQTELILQTSQEIVRLQRHYTSEGYEAFFHLQSSDDIKIIAYVLYSCVAEIFGKYVPVETNHNVVPAIPRLSTQPFKLVSFEMGYQHCDGKEVIPRVHYGSEYYRLKYFKDKVFDWGPLFSECFISCTPAFFNLKSGEAGLNVAARGYRGSSETRDADLSYYTKNVWAEYFPIVPEILIEQLEKEISGVFELCEPAKPYIQIQRDRGEEVTSDDDIYDPGETKIQGTATNTHASINLILIRPEIISGHVFSCDAFCQNPERYNRNDGRQVRIYANPETFLNPDKALCFQTSLNPKCNLRIIREGFLKILRDFKGKIENAAAETSENSKDDLMNTDTETDEIVKRRRLS